MAAAVVSTMVTAMKPNNSEDQNILLRNENSELKQSLYRLQEAYQELQHDNKFQQVKVSELQEILDLRGEQDATSQKLVTKSMQNAELASENDILKMQLNHAKSSADKLGQQREESKRMLLELSDIVCALKSVQVEYDAASLQPQDGGTNTALSNVKAKVETIMEDRRLLVLRCKELEKQSKEKDSKLLALEAQFHLLNNVNIARGESMDEDVSIATSLNSVASRSESSAHSKRFDLREVQEEFNENLIRSPTKSKDSTSKEDATWVSQTTSPTSQGSQVASLHSRSVGTFEDSQDIEVIKKQLTQSVERYNHFKAVCASAFSRMGEVEKELKQARGDLDLVAHRRDELRENLKDVIGQYKGLHAENEAVCNQLKLANSKIGFLEATVKSFEDEKSENVDQCMTIIEQEGLSGDVEKLVEAYAKARGIVQALKERLEAAEREAVEAGEKREAACHKIRDSVALYRSVMQERDSLEFRLSKAEADLEAARNEARKQKEDAKATRRRLTYLRKEGLCSEKTRKDEPSAVTGLELPDLSDPKSKESNATPDNKLEAPALEEARSSELERLTLENEELRAFCEEMLSDVAGTEQQ